MSFKLKKQNLNKSFKIQEIIIEIIQERKHHLKNIELDIK